MDENLPKRLVPVLAGLGHDVYTVLQEALGGHEDPDVWIAAQSAKRFLIGQDLDFSDIRLYPPGTHEGVLILRLREPGRDVILRRVESLFLTEDVENWHGCIVIATETKVRIRRPPA